MLSIFNLINAYDHFHLFHLNLNRFTAIHAKSINSCILNNHKNRYTYEIIFLKYNVAFYIKNCI